MQIPRELPQFTDHNVLLVVSGALYGKLFLAQDGMLYEVYEYAVPRPAYSDNEGFFVSSGKGQTYSSGSVLEDRRLEDQRRYLAAVAESVTRVVRETELNEVYVSAPQHIAPLLFEALPPIVRERVSRTAHANAVHEHPLEVLARFAEPS